MIDQQAIPRSREFRADQNEVTGDVRGEEPEQRDKAKRIDVARDRRESHILARYVIELC